MEVKITKLKSGEHSAWFRFRHHCQTFAGTARGATEAKARKAAEAEITTLKAQATLGKVVTPGKSPTLARFIRDTYQAWAKRKRSHYDDELICQAICKELGHYRLSEVRPKVVRSFQAARIATPTKHGDPRSNNTVNRELSVLSSVLKLAVQEEWLEFNPCAAVTALPRGEHVVRFLSHDEYDGLLAQLGADREHLRAPVLASIYTGMRQKELLTLRRRQLDFEAELIRLDATDTKTGRTRVVPMSDIVKAELAYCERFAPNDFVFSSPHPKYVGARLIDPKRAFNKACELAAIENFSWHCLRHTFGTWSAAAGVGVHLIKEIMGHTDIRTTMIYVHAAANQTKAAVGQMADWAFLERERQKNGKNQEKKREDQIGLPGNVLIFQSVNEMDQRRIELLTSALRTRRSPS